jgi:hypothetical protein
MPENTLKEIVQQLEGEIIVDKDAAKRLAKEADALWQEKKAREDSRYLAKASQWIVSAWEILMLIGKLKPGQVLVVDSEGNIRRGIVSEERLKKFQLLPQKAPKRIPSNLDGAEFEYKSLVGKSYDEMPAVSTGFSHKWITTARKVKLVQETPLLDMFMEIAEAHPEKLFYETVEDFSGRKSTVFSLDGITTKVTVNEFGRMISYQDAHGIEHKVF